MHDPDKIAACGGPIKVDRGPQTGTFESGSHKGAVTNLDDGYGDEDVPGAGFLAATFLVRPFLPDEGEAAIDVCSG